MKAVRPRLVAVALLAMALAATARAAELTDMAGRPDAPALALAALDGTVYDIAALRGRVVVINFWATWCAPCVNELPALQRAQDRLAPRGVVFLAVNMGQRGDLVEAFVRRTGLRLPVLLDPTSAAAAAWLVKALPTSYVVSPAGKVAYGAIGEVAWISPETVDRIGALTLDQDRDRQRSSGD